ncbi:hypothetical protein Pyn_31816 [Prunus yedoensis var. nudiflora]|uniref:Uncharacterized protein n=1 Tax=Prunus yedoensis var. nudiflora TaxID=2094558 RepID=A0A314UZJ5_PRUYE|nr:hypothetical protein Pyn_31816 [Prunus yedoensis var. nudiflora]
MGPISADSLPGRLRPRGRESLAPGPDDRAGRVQAVGGGALRRSCSGERQEGVDVARSDWGGWDCWVWGRDEVREGVDWDGDWGLRAWRCDFDFSEFVWVGGENGRR